MTVPLRPPGENDSAPEPLIRRAFAAHGVIDFRQFHLLVCKMAEQGELQACPASAEGQAAKATADTATAEKASADVDKAAAQKAAVEKIAVDKRVVETAAAEKEAAS